MAIEITDKEVLRDYEVVGRKVSILLQRGSQSKTVRYTAKVSPIDAHGEVKPLHVIIDSLNDMCYKRAEYLCKELMFHTFKINTVH